MSLVPKDLGICPPKLTTSHLRRPLSPDSGTTYVMPLPDADISAVRALFEANVFGVMATTSAFLPLLIASSSTSPSSSLPTIVLISSQADRSPFPFKGSYAMSKAALSAYGRTLAVELDALGVRVLTVITGYVTSHMGRGSSGAPVQPTLPQGSLFDAMKDALVPNVAGKRMSADEYARRVVGEVAKGKGWAWGGWGGTREWIWAGGKTTAVWFLALWPEAVLKAVVLRRWPFWMLRQAREKKRV